MNWPMPQDYNEAIQSPHLVFSDPDLKTGETVIGATGLPLPRSGNFADVYQIRGADGRNWAVKCFTRKVVGLAERYARVDEALTRLKLPFGVGFSFLSEGIHVLGEKRPAVKMEWVEGLLLNQVVLEKLNQPAILGTLGQLWGKLCKRLRESGIAHTDIQHGNVMLVPGSRAGAYGLKLIDYDGMFVPALANTPSGECGHPSYQHPGRAAGRIYSADLDRFPHLVIATALKGLETGGTALWEQYDNGDNLLFTEKDFQAPNTSKLIRELWQQEIPALQTLVGSLALSCGKPIPQTPWLDQIAPDGEPIPLDNAARKEVALALGLALPVPVASAPDPWELISTSRSSAPDSASVPTSPSPYTPQSPVRSVVAAATPGFDVDDPPTKSKKASKSPKNRKAKETKRNRMLAIGGAIALLIGGGVAALLQFGGKQQAKDVAQVDEPKRPDPKDTNAISTGSAGGDRGSTQTKDKEPAPDKKGPKENDKKEANTAAAKKPEVPPLDPGAFAIKERARVETKGVYPALLTFDRDGRSVITNSNGGFIGAIDLQKAAYNQLLSIPSKDSLPEVIPLHGGRVASWSRGQKQITVTDIQTGRLLTPLPFPTFPAGGDIGVVLGISADDRYIAAGRRSFFGMAAGDKEKSYLPVPFRLLDTKTGKNLLAFDWRSGSIHFNSDSSRILVVDAYLHGRWFKLPTGEPDGEWKFGDKTVGPHPLEIQHSSSDGRLLLCHGSYEGQSNVMMLMDGYTGRVTKILGPADRGFGTISVDGGTVLFVESVKGSPQKDFVVFDTNSGVELARAPIKDRVARFSLALAPNGRCGAVTLTEGKDATTVRIFDLQLPSEPAR